MVKIFTYRVKSITKWMKIYNYIINIIIYILNLETYYHEVDINSVKIGTHQFNFETNELSQLEDDKIQRNNS